jgi:hypothetical protein
MFHNILFGRSHSTLRESNLHGSTNVLVVKCGMEQNGARIFNSKESNSRAIITHGETKMTYL